LLGEIVRIEHEYSEEGLFQSLPDSDTRNVTRSMRWHPRFHTSEYHSIDEMASKIPHLRISLADEMAIQKIPYLKTPLR